MDSWATNSFGIGVSSGGKAWNNRVLGGGYHVCAFGWGDRLTITSNFVHLRAAKLEEKRWPEYGDAASNNGVRLTQYNGSKNPYNDDLVEKNVIVLESSGGRQTRGVQIFSDPYVKNFVFRENTVKIMALDPETTNGACARTGLTAPESEHEGGDFAYQSGGNDRSTHMSS